MWQGRWWRICGLALVLLIALSLAAPPTHAQDGSTGAIRGRVEDISGARIAGAQVSASNDDNGTVRRTLADAKGNFAAQLLPPGAYTVRVTSPGMQTELQNSIRVELGTATEVLFQLRVAENKESVTVVGESRPVETQSNGVSNLIDARAIAELPLNGRRFTDLALLTPGVTQDPRGLTSGSNGDLSSGGIRGFQTSFLVDGADNNNGFSSQARGGYRAPYQFSNEVVQEFRVASSGYSSELGRAGGAVINIVTKSGGNQFHGSAFYNLRDSSFNARTPGLNSRPTDRQHQGGVTFGGPLKHDRVFLFAGYDQHLFRVPTAVRFDNGSPAYAPQKGQEPLFHGDYEDSDHDLVFAQAAQLSTLGGDFPSSQIGNTTFAKTDFALNSHNQLSARISTSRYWGTNNVFLDLGNPITNSAISDNGQERVTTETAALSLNSGLTNQLTNNLRAQVSRDLQRSVSNSNAPLARIPTVLEGFGRSSVLPRRTSEDRLHLAETLHLEKTRHSLKLGGDALITRIDSFFPALSGGEYIFDKIKVNPFTFIPEEGGLELTPFRAYAHNVPRYYIQNFGSPHTQPNTREYSAFAQDTIRLRDNLNVTLGVRYDLQTFAETGLTSNPLWPQSGRAPHATNNFAPRFGFAWSLRGDHPFVVRGGFGIFYSRISQMYESALATENGSNSLHLILDNTHTLDRQFFPAYPDALVTCSPTATTCLPPTGLLSQSTTDVSAFAPNYKTPQVQQSSLSVEKELGARIVAEVSFLHTHGVHMIRARDVNLPPPADVQYPVFDEAGINLLGYYPVQTFSTWQLTQSLSCPVPPCLNPLIRPIPQLGAINVFETHASSQYNGLTVSVQRRMRDGLYFRMGYTWAHAIDDGQDALVAGRPVTVQNSFGTSAEKASSVTDQRHRLVFSVITEPNPMPASQHVLSSLFNHWKLASVVTVGSGRPYEAKVTGDPNQDGNTLNDRLPGLGRNSLVGPSYSTTDARFGRDFHISNRVHLELLVESFNLLNHANKRLIISEDGFQTQAAQFVPFAQRSGTTFYPGQYRRGTAFTAATSTYAPRQLEVAIRLKF